MRGNRLQCRLKVVCSLMQVYGLPDVAEQVDKMRDEMRLHGETHVDCAELMLLCRDIVAEKERNKGIAQIAQWEDWTYVDLPDGSVHFFGLGQR